MINPDTLTKIYNGNYAQQLELCTMLLYSIIEESFVTKDVSDLLRLEEEDNDIANSTVTELWDLEEREKIELIIHILTFLKCDISKTAN